MSPRKDSPLLFPHFLMRELRAVADLAETPQQSCAKATNLAAQIEAALHSGNGERLKQLCGQGWTLLSGT